MSFKEKAPCLPIFHALTGCDTSAFHGKGKRSAWQTWEVFDEVTPALTNLTEHPFNTLDVTSEYFQAIERFIILMYDKSSPSMSINKTRKELFCKNNRAVDKLPPTQNALDQHVKRCVYQSGIWNTSYLSCQDLPDPEGFGWKREDGEWVPVWMTQPEASKSCRELVKCACKTKCTRCKCVKASLACTDLCKCSCLN